MKAFDPPSTPWKWEGESWRCVRFDVRKGYDFYLYERTRDAMLSTCVPKPQNATKESCFEKHGTVYFLWKELSASSDIDVTFFALGVSDGEHVAVLRRFASVEETARALFSAFIERGADVRCAADVFDELRDRLADRACFAIKL